MILLKIQREQYTDDDKFIEALKRRFVIEFMGKVDQRRLEVFQDYLIQQFQFKNKINLTKICINSLKRSIIVKDRENYTLQIDPNEKIENMVNTSTIISLINSGTLEIDPYPIFTEVQTKIMNNIDKIYSLYQMGFSI